MLINHLNHQELKSPLILKLLLIIKELDINCICVRFNFYFDIAVFNRKFFNISSPGDVINKGFYGAFNNVKIFVDQNILDGNIKVAKSDYNNKDLINWSIEFNLSDDIENIKRIYNLKAFW